MNPNEERLLSILRETTPRDKQELLIECLKMGIEMERRFLGSRLGRRQAVLDHARAFVDFVTKTSL